MPFAEVIQDQKLHLLRLRCQAADHVHILIRKHKHSAEEMMENLKTASRQKLIGLFAGLNGTPSGLRVMAGRFFKNIRMTFANNRLHRT